MSRTLRVWLAVALAIPMSLSAWAGVRNLMAKRATADKPAAATKPNAVEIAAETAAMANAHFTVQIRPFLKTYCITCHDEQKESGGINFDPFVDQTTALRDRKLWLAAAEVMRTKQMPPKNKPAPSDAERSMFLDWIEQSLAAIDCGPGRDPGRPTIRRLNRAEYNNTIRDLVGINFQPAEDFPSDDIGYGFDNIGDVLTLSPMLLEKYLAAAEKILDQAIVVETPIRVSRDVFSPQSLRSSLGRPAVRPTRQFPLLGEGRLYMSFDFVHTGNYKIFSRMAGRRAGNELPKIDFLVDGRRIGSTEIDAQEGHSKTYHAEAHIPPGRHEIAVALTNFLEDKTPSDTRAPSRGVLVETIEIEGPFNPVPPPLPASHRLIMTASPLACESKEAAARQIIDRFVTRAYRRPALKSEVDRLLKFFGEATAEGEPFERAIQLALRPVLVSPHFLFRIEKDVEPDNPRSVHPVSDYELATRLAYFLWSSMPDDELRSLAGRGDLREAGVIEAQVKRMLAHPHARALTDNFAAQWLNLRMIPSLAPDAVVFPEFDADLKAAMVAETEMFFDHVARNDRSVLEFLDSDWTFVNERLARHYGISGVHGPSFRKVQLTDGIRGGLITQASVLTLTSNPTRTSPVKRGKWVLENILGTPPPPPPPNVPDLDGQNSTLKGSLRERMQQHRSNALCASCHQKMDPIGFGLENFDGIGGWRTADGEYMIDASGELPGEERFAGPAQLRQVLLSRADQFRRNIAEKMLTYALGRGLEYYDKCAVDEIVNYLTVNEDRFSALIVAIVKSDPFQKRRGGSRD